jgi:hypothetical protein
MPSLVLPDFNAASSGILLSRFEKIFLRGSTFSPASQASKNSARSGMTSLSPYCFTSAVPEFGLNVAIEETTSFPCLA